MKTTNFYSRSFEHRLRDLFIAILIFVSTGSLPAQSFEWIDAHPLDYGSNPAELGSSVCADPNNNIYFSGLQNQVSGTYGDVFLKKYDNEFNLMDEIVFLGECRVFAILSDGNGNLMVSLDTKSEINFSNTEDTIPYLGGFSNTVFIKMNDSMELDWFISKDYNSSGLKGFEMALDAENNIYLGHGSFTNQSFVTKYDTEGNQLLQIGQNNVPVISSVSVDSEGNIYSAGSCADADAVFGGTPYDPGFSYSSYLAKYNSFGEVQWVKFIEDVTCPRPKVVAKDPGFVYLSGPLQLPALFDTIQTTGPSWVYDFYLARLNEDGDFLWVREVPEINLGDATIGINNSLGTDEQKNVYITGFIRGDIDWGNGLVTNSTSNYYDFLALKYDSEGELLYARSLGGEGYDAGTSSFVDGIGNCYLSGTAHGTITVDTSMITPDEGLYAFVVKIGNDIQTRIPDNPLSGFTVFPNPAVDRITILNPGSKSSGKVNIRITSLEGKLLITKHGINLKESSIDVRQLNKGVYILRISTSSGIVRWTKFVKQ
ncbi:MAG: T9SS type A sorting domain-containing protein [Chlorobi bacterium]|nr:T9SS type A sorting domain-containing protein [Chlorobiota bacterium]